MVNLTPNVYAHWKLNETTGTLVSDSSINGRDGTLINMGDADWVAGKLNNCLQFDGTTQYVDCENIAGFERTDAFSLECWVKTSVDDRYQFLFNKREGTAINKGYAVYLDKSTRLSVYIGSDATNFNFIAVRGNTYLNDGVWHHVIVTYDGSSDANGITIYVDNSPESIYIAKNNLSANITHSAILRIAGNHVYGYSPVGYVDEVIIYDKELDTDEVEFRWNNGNGRENFETLPAPSNPIPIDTAIDISYNQDLDWTSIGILFDIYFGTSNPPPLVQENHPTSDYNPGNLDSCTIYYWKIMAKNVWGDEATSDIWSFTTNNELPVTPHSNSPAHEAINQDLSLTLSWDCEDYNPNDSLVYDIYFGTTPSPPLLKADHGSKSYNVSGLINDRKYYWKIIAKDDASCGIHNTTSPIWNFKTVEIATGGHESFDPRKAYRDQLASLWNVNKDCDELEKCIYIENSKGDRVYIPMYLSEEIESEQLPTLPFLELEIPPGHTTYEVQDILASTRKMESLILIHIYFTDTDSIDRTEFAKKIKNRLHDLTRYYQSSTTGIVFMNIEDDGLEEETDGHRVVFHYIATLYCLYYDTCVEP